MHCINLFSIFRWPFWAKSDFGCHNEQQPIIAWADWRNRPTFVRRRSRILIREYVSSLSETKIFRLMLKPDLQWFKKHMMMLALRPYLPILICDFCRIFSMYIFVIPDSIKPNKGDIRILPGSLFPLFLLVDGSEKARWETSNFELFTV